MKLKQHNNISESQVEDAIVSDLSYFGRIINVPDNLKIVSRQLRLKSGTQILDLLLMSGRKLLLVELKITEFKEDYIGQILKYREGLIRLQYNNELVSGNIDSYLLVSKATKKQIDFSKQKDVFVIVYEPIEILKNYFENLSMMAPFLKMKPNDYGVFNLGLINRALIGIFNGMTNQKEIALKTNLSKGSIHNHLRVAKEFGLVEGKNQNCFLASMGIKYVESRDKDIPVDRLSDKQIDILKIFIAKDPFYSSLVFGVYSIIESAFLLSRNVYPIQLSDLKNMFRIVAGKEKEWKAEKSLSTASYTFLNYAVDLELLGKIGKQIVITPAGFKFILMLQLHKSIEMIESLTGEEGKYNDQKTD